MKKNRYLKPKSLIWLVNAYLIFEIICFSLSAFFGSLAFLKKRDLTT